MEPLSSIQLLIVAALTIFTKTDAQVSLETLDTLQNSFICGKEQILICTIESYSSMSWSKDTYPDPLASCSFSICDVNPSMRANYNFTFKPDIGVFQIKILTVKVSNNDTTYFCGDGFVSSNISTIVKVENDFSIENDSKTINSNTTEVSVTTGCIQDKVAEGVKFEWWLQEVNNTSSKKRKINESETDTMYNSSVCIADPDCGVSGYSFITNSVNITNEESGKTYRIGVNIISGVTLINSVSFDLFFILNFQVSETAKCNNDCVILITIAYCTIFLIVILMCVFDVYQYSSSLKQEYERILSEMNSNEIRLKDKRLRLKEQYEADLKKLYAEDERFLSEMNANELRSENKRLRLKEQYETNLKQVDLEDNRSRLEMERLLALKKPHVKAIIGITLLCGVPFIGLVAKGLLVYNRRKSDHLQCLQVILVVLFMWCSMICELFIILLCEVWCICQWYALILLFPELISRWIECIIVAVLYHGDIDETNHIDQPAHSTGRIALSCVPIIGFIYNLLRHVKYKPAKSLSVSPEPDVDHRTDATNQDANSTSETIHKANNKQHTPRPLRKLPKVTSSSQLQETEVEMKKHPILPQIK